MDIRNKSLNLPIAIISVAIPVLVAILFYLPRPHIEAGFNVYILPLFHAILNSATAVLLLGSLFFIKRGQIKAHKITNLIAVGLSAIFLVSYVTYHFFTESTKYGDANHDGIVDATEKALVSGSAYIYYFILLAYTACNYHCTTGFVYITERFSVGLCEA
jgi:putative membrane protein